MKARIEYNQYPDSAAAAFFSKLGGACGYLLIPLGLLLIVWGRVHFGFSGFRMALWVVGCMAVTVLAFFGMICFCEVMEIKCAVRTMTRPQKRAPGGGAGPEPAAPVKPKQEKKRNALCPFCGREIMPEACYCNSCGKDLSEAGELEKAASFFDPEYTRKTCIACGAAIPMGARYCHLCGADQKWEGRYVPPSNPENDGEQPENTPESREGPAFRQRMLESAYLTMFDAPEGESVGELFPAGWYGACDETRILALSEAVSKRLRIEETNAWQKAEGTRS